MPAPRLPLCLLLAASLLAVSPHSACADEEGGLAWGYLATELSTAGVFALNFGVEGWPNEGPAFAVNFAPSISGDTDRVLFSYGGAF